MKKIREKILQDIKILKKKKLDNADVHKLSEIRQKIEYIEEMEKVKKRGFLFELKSVLKKYFGLKGLKFGALIGFIFLLATFCIGEFTIRGGFFIIILLTLGFVVFSVPILRARKHNNLRVIYSVATWEVICATWGVWFYILVKAIYGGSIIVVDLIGLFLSLTALGAFLGILLSLTCIYFHKILLGFPGAIDEKSISRYFTVKGNLEKIGLNLRRILIGLGFYVRGPNRLETVEYLKGERALGFDPNRITIMLNKKNKNKVEVGILTYKDIGPEPLATDIGHEFAKWLENIITMSFPSATSVKSISQIDKLRYLSFREVILKPQMDLLKAWGRRNSPWILFLIGLIGIIFSLLR